MASLKNAVGEDGSGPVQPADLFGSHEAPVGGKLRWYHRNFLSSAVTAEDFFLLLMEKKGHCMIITDFLERNARLYGGETSLVEINPSEERDKAVTWWDFNLIESASPDAPIAGRSAGRILTAGQTASQTCC